MKTEIKIEANQETTQNAANLSFQSSIRGSVRMERPIPLKLPLFDASTFEIFKAFQPSKTLCKQSQLIQIIEEIRSPKINKSLHDLQSLFKGDAVVESSVLANLQVQRDNLLELALLVGNQVASCLGFRLGNFQ